VTRQTADDVSLNEIQVPGLTQEAARELDRRADLAGLPLLFIPPRPQTRWRAARRAHVEMTDLRDDPSVASEALDHPDGWPQDRDVRERMRRAIGENAPEVASASRLAGQTISES